MTTERRYAPLKRGFFPENDYTVTGDWHFTGQVTLDDVVGSFEPRPHTQAASEIPSGVFDEARISQSSVTQYRSALSFTYAQITVSPATTVDWADITGIPSLFAPEPHIHDLGTDVYG